MSAYHIPVLLKESVEGLNINPKGIYVDVTFGGGGHSTEILKTLGKGKLYAFDQDEDALRNLPGSLFLTCCIGCQLPAEAGRLFRNNSLIHVFTSRIKNRHAI